MNETCNCCHGAECPSHPDPKLVDAVIGEWDKPKKGTFAQIMQQRAEEAEEALAEFKSHNQDLRDELADSRTRHRKLLDAVKGVLGFKNWPEIKGDFLDGVIILLQAHDSHMRAAWAEAVADRDAAINNDPRWTD